MPLTKQVRNRRFDTRNGPDEVKARGTQEALF